MTDGKETPFNLPLPMKWPENLNGAQLPFIPPPVLPPVLPPGSFPNMLFFNNDFENFKPAPLSSQNAASTYLTQVYFRPLFGTQEFMMRVFEREGFKNINSIKLHEKYGFVRFQTASEAELFVEHFDKFNVGRVKLTVELSPKTISANPPCKRICLKGYDYRIVGERDIYFLCAPLGFLRHICYHHDYSFVDYDTTDDATNAVEHLNNGTFKGSTIYASFEKASQVTDLSSLTIPLTDIIPSNHEFWTILADRLQIH